MAETYDIISVRSGHHGLLAAAYMAKGGKRVLVLERNDHIGGGGVTKEIAPSFLPRVSGLGWPASDTWRRVSEASLR